MSHTRLTLRSDAGFSLVEMMISMTILTVIMGATLGGLSDIMKANQNVMMVATTNNTLRGGMDLMVRDLLQVGSGLPASHAVTIPSGAGSQRVRIPGPPGTRVRHDHRRPHPAGRDAACRAWGRTSTAWPPTCSRC